MQMQIMQSEGFNFDFKLIELATTKRKYFA